MSANSKKAMFVGVILAFAMSAQLATMAAAMAAEINVTTLVDEDVANADCSLREAMVAANTDTAHNGCPAGSGADTIGFLVNGTILLTTNLPTVNLSLSIIGPGAANLTIDGDEQYRMFNFGFPLDAGNHQLKGLTLRDGASTPGTAPAVTLAGVNVIVEDAVIRGMKRTGVDSGGAIAGINGTLTVRRTTFFDNSTLDGSGGAISAFTLTVIVEDSLFVGNDANGATATGGAIAAGNTSNVTLRRSTFTNNTAGSNGGALSQVAASASITIESCTFKGNSAPGIGGGFMTNNGTASIRNSVFAGNEINPPPGGSATPDISQTDTSILTSLGHNLIGDNTGAATVFPAGNPNVNDDYVGTAASPIVSGLEALADNGGPTFTHRTLVSSPLIDKGSCTGEPHDQRRYGNPLTGLRIIDIAVVANSGDGCDIGAFERGAQLLGTLFLDGYETPDP